MSNSVFNSLGGAVRRFVPERRIYMRSDAHTRYWTMTPGAQVGLCVVGLGLLAWSAWTSIFFVQQTVAGAQETQEISAVHDAYQLKLARLTEERDGLAQRLALTDLRSDQVAKALSDKQRTLIDARDALERADIELLGLRNTIDTLVAERSNALTTSEALRRQVDALRLEMAALEGGEAERNGALAALAETMQGIISERDAAADRAATLDGEVDDLRGKLARWESRQEHLLASLEDAARLSLDELDKVFSSSDLDLDEILKATRSDYSGQGGGPFSPIDVDDLSLLDETDETDERIASLMSELERVNLMRIAIDRLPFGMPTVGARMTSGFGPRRDPFRHHIAQHNGMDFAAPRGTPIMTTADGVVTFSGRQRGYGVTVKIRHAFGFETVYAHLSKSRVKVGQRVRRGDHIADMGSTGRSTGSHLHYEIRIGKKPVNPSKFIRAARNVL